MNKEIVSGLKKRLEGAKGKWTEELLNVLWAYQTTPRRSTGETPFFMSYGTKVVIPVEISMSSIRASDFSPDSNEGMMAEQLDLL